VDAVDHALRDLIALARPAPPVAPASKPSGAGVPVTMGGVPG
jgi:hypothetical protein